MVSQVVADQIYEQETKHENVQDDGRNTSLGKPFFHSFIHSFPFLCLPSLPFHFSLFTSSLLLHMWVRCGMLWLRVFINLPASLLHSSRIMQSFKEYVRMVPAY
jgi:hypothetical protein